MQLAELLNELIKAGSYSLGDNYIQDSSGGEKKMSWSEQLFESFTLLLSIENKAVSTSHSVLTMSHCYASLVKFLHLRKISSRISKRRSSQFTVASIPLQSTHRDAKCSSNIDIE